jgi:hypothetical protein
MSAARHEPAARLDVNAIIDRLVADGSPSTPPTPASHLLSFP